MFIASVSRKALGPPTPSSSSSPSLTVSYSPKAPQPHVPTAPEANVERPPPDFGWQSKLNKMERYLVDFYLSAWCAGRAILSSTNCWIQDIAQMGDGNACVRHAILALSSTYVLDYKPDEKIRQASNAYYERAVTLLTDALKDERELRPGGSEGTVAAIALLNMMDVVSPEHRRSKNLLPRWLEGARMACRLLDATDPGHRYWNAENIQTSHAWVANTIISSRAAILALPMAPLDPANTGGQQFQWLLSHGNEAEARRIHGACGFSPRLLHRIAQVTHLAALLEEDPDSVTIPEVATAILKELHNLRQWSEINPRGHDSTDALLAHCDKRLGPSGVVVDRASMADLTAEAWRLAAIIYSLCRLYRLPRSHDEVIVHMAKLAACINRTPTSGSLFTAQAPFFPVFLLGLLAVKEDHVQSAMRWFESVMQTYCRSSVPPVYEALRRARKLLPDHLGNPTTDLPDHIGHRYAWWETLVAEVTRNEGILCLV
ncbi:hypothetical protein SODALDRAFT_282398 [Sodiomyces alkalinus F11]|uniref:Uncharacterized protein n=1 Tax=Sodiomyces alkalinus (strain CBS 110278 / VKM F-3762 / F11) TaxID=1314773 RepID=A0A3N2PQ40_SODAK|nr:hypothetical protein SODALDRAFT_282398 [Sodiomyces alkalinus F11]ROT36574.1 hypothetical protein SODALDRAFT_282398 [Sodiomyces alkalinus F11]